MQIAFSKEEARTLASALKIYLSELRSEVVHTDDRAYRADMLQYEHTLETLRNRMLTALNESESGIEQDTVV